MLAIAVSASGASPEQGQLDGSPTLFTVMAALDAAGYGAEAQSPNNHPLRQQARAEIAKKNPPSLQALKAFFQQRRKPTDAADLAQYVSFALSVKGPPDFALAQREVETAPDAAALKGLSQLLARFYKEANIEDLWTRSQPAIEENIARYHAPVADAVLQVNSYLRQQTSGFRGRRFQIYIELLAPPNQVQTRSYGDEYIIVVTPSPAPRTFEVRHAYLHYLLDPLATRSQEILDRKKGIADHAQRAQALDASFKGDFLQLTTECLIKAVEARLDRKANGVEQALRQGFILTPFFAEQLRDYEKQEQAMMLYFPDMAKAIDLKKEEDRLVNVEFDRVAPAGAVVRTPAPPPAQPLTGAAKTLDTAEQLYALRAQEPANLDKARNLYLDALQQTDSRSLHAAAYYGLARIAALQKDPEAAQRLFRRVLELEPEPQVKAWALVYLGRLALASADREEAVRDFQEALKVDGAPETARKAAAEGLESNRPKP
jgi:tetratricopeptide (TPR) repeat protein